MTRFEQRILEIVGSRREGVSADQIWLDLSTTVFDGEMMAIQNPISDLARATQHEPNEDWPASVAIEVRWVSGEGKVTRRCEVISAAQFFGHGNYGAPIDGAFLVSAIERMRRAGPPKPERKVKAKR